ncbi:ATP synthase F1 subunit delta [Candidatus Finniella inopinata]|uniref:ATP synthase subunit delta n=1 Tax=Candidatus Finniella inopinata TaxID=1696036 RepID=A0A4Q7DK27_9PROT|nr:ATP synthase F1 subunit delta [Candidatus Finniella inopinata]RZI46535.1 ATP synthase F1 subunit delta [Candidatus Finniella inopinata]
MDKNLLKILMTSVSGRYARALFACAQQNGIVERLSSDLKALNLFHKQNRRLWLELSSKVLAPHQTTLLWQQVSERLNLHHILMNFIFLLGKSNRLDIWPSFVQCYQFLTATNQDKSQVVVYTPTELPAADQRQLISNLKKLWPVELVLTYIVSPHLKMGMMIESNNLRLDMTLDAQLSALHKTLPINSTK